MKTADAFTWVRIVLAPVFFLLYIIPEQTGSFLALSVYIIIPLLIFAEFTDFLDGYFARRNNEVSDFGKLFDPFADVILHLTTFFCYTSSGYMPLWCLFLIVQREVAIQFVRLMVQRKGVTMGAAMGGKVKTVLYVAAGMFSLAIESAVRLGYAADIQLDVLKTINIALYIACVIASYASFFHYIMQFKRMYSKK